MKGTVQYDGSSSEPFDIRSGVKQGCVLAPTLFGIFFALVLKHAFSTATEGIHLHTRSDGRLFNLARLRAKTKVRKALIRDMLFADDVAVVTHTQQELQSLMDRFSQACKDFGLTISLKKTNILGQDLEAPPVIAIDNYELDVVHQFTYLGSTISNNLSLDTEIDKRIGKAATTLARLTTRVWENPKLCQDQDGSVQRLRHQHTALRQRDVGNIRQAREKTEHFSPEAAQTALARPCSSHEDDLIPKAILYGALSSCKRDIGRPQLRYKDVCKRDMKAPEIDTEAWEDLAADRSRWRSTLTKQLKAGEESLLSAAKDKRARRKENCNSNSAESIHKCDLRGRDCHSRIGLFSHRRRCSSRADT
ncbi:hypothetical protein SKAU_G00091520 [Synaphobranchus kaupii]|uniref:Reverse transcriptase domain-containing protein n=1 Tax=Synaphobranchus kaupii TaxID=118154 RepID=A0A9Q1J672_SYNKA|nr:hypothetical protein SKAU_G00091520 [Synaphobranchus kaupii]